VSENASVLASFVACLELAFSLPFSKRRQGLTGLIPTKALKTVPASAAGAAARHAGWVAFAQDALERGAQAARAAMEQASQADPFIGAVVVPGGLLTWPWLRARLTCYQCRRRLLSWLLLIRPRSRPPSPISPFLAPRKGPTLLPRSATGIPPP
jgi:hypothetical protein